jgi:alpha-L-fucosidase
MGFSYGYNRAERIEHYHTGRELVILLTDLVSRGGNRLLDIGPAADGTIPVVMEERLLQIGSWLTVNGEAILWNSTVEAHAAVERGEVPKLDYNQEYNSDYDVTRLTAKQPTGKASIEAFYTSKEKDVYAILLRWPGGRFTVKAFDAAGLKSVTLRCDSSREGTR